MVIMIAFFLLGCTGSPEPSPDVNSGINDAAEANAAIDDVSTDLSGLDQALNEIDSELGEE